MSVIKDRFIRMIMFVFKVHSRQFEFTLLGLWAHRRAAASVT